MISVAQQALPQDDPNYTIKEAVYRSTRITVYRGVERATRRPVVIKVLSQPYPTFGELVQFRNQYTITKNLSFPGIVKPLGLETFDNCYALVMEDLGSVALSSYMEQQTLELADVLDVAIQLTDILGRLHQAGVIHKDIKPGNILIHPETKTVQLIDFSIASLLPKETQELQSPKQLEGTLAYLAPEQTGRMNRAIDYRADFYALGVTLYELLTGILPFTSDDPMELIHCHIAQVAPSVNRVNPEVSPMVARIVAKLMEKNAEERYQSALGLRHDLERCLEQWRLCQTIEEFDLGTRDICDRFTIPEKLYGRDGEVQTLLDAFDRVSKGASELMLVAGFSGIGKTAVINEVHKPIVRQRGYFIEGKFDQFNRNVPFSAFVHAFRELMGQLLSESDEDLARWKSQILAAIGNNGQVLTDVIPELEHVIGPQPAASQLSGNAAQNRFNVLFQKFIGVFTSPTHPLVIFLDDLQWADPASLNLMKVLMGEGSNGYLLLLGAYRDNEVFPAHPLMVMLDKAEEQRTVLSTIALSPLSEDHINQLVADTLSCPVDRARPLTEALYPTTLGNPFFTTQFLQALHKDQHLTFNDNLGFWECDLVTVKSALLGDDVVAFMASRLQKLPEPTQNILKLAACIGNQFDLQTVAIAQNSTIETIAADLWPALREGLILPLTDAYKFFQEQDQPPTPLGEVGVGYRF
ncbi:MAG: serine/threonine-protein kinase PknK, partial [Cyanobacteria bacterium P01_F01_bin.153]